MKPMMWCLVFLAVILPCSTSAQHSVAREWNEALLAAIRKDFARPTVHARNLFQTAVVMYDAWAAYDRVAEPWLLGRTVGSFTCPFEGVAFPPDIHAARNEAVSYAAYRLLKYRFQYSPGAAASLHRFDSLMVALGYDPSFTSTAYAYGSPAALGNYIAQQMIAFGLQDGANEEFNYGNLHYQPVNPPLDPTRPGDSTILDPNRWQPLTLGTFIDQNGNHIPIATPPFLGAEWGDVVPFALTPADRQQYTRDGYTYSVYLDPGAPPSLDSTNATGEITLAYKWAFTLVSVWSGQLDATDGVLWDISPASIGNVQSLPRTLSGLQSFYDLQGGGDTGTGRPVNPRTGLPYQPQVVPRGDYARVLAEFWADGPNSETPPGHWFTILNYVNDHPAFHKRFGGTGPIRDELEWDVKAYFILGGAVHDAAVAAWGVKGWYDYVRPISAIRYMADHGQCSDPGRPQYSAAGIPLIPGWVDIVGPGDSLAGPANENIGRIKIYAWRGHYYVSSPDTAEAHAGWILAGDWWPYQRPTFVTPPFAGYVSGHSTFSRAAAEVMTLLTGDEFFPGGMGEFHAPRNQYLVFEDGPSVDVTLQWATYRDASDQCSLSRIWGGIHPPVDDMPGRLIGQVVGPRAFAHAVEYFDGTIGGSTGLPDAVALEQNYPNPFNPTTNFGFQISAPGHVRITIYDLLGRRVATPVSEDLSPGRYIRRWNAAGMASGVYFYRLEAGETTITRRLVVVR